MNDFFPQINAISTAVLFGIFQGVSIVAIFKVKGIVKEHSYFILFIASLLVIQTESFLLRSGYIIHSLFLFNTSVPFIFILGPLLFFYTQRRLSKKLSIRKLLIHLAPFLLYATYSFNFFLQPNGVKYNAYIRTYHLSFETIPVTLTFATDPWNIQGWVVVELLSAHMFMYSLLSLFAVHQNLKLKPDKNKIQWLTYLNAILLMGAVVLFLSQGGVINGYVFFKSPFPSYAPDLCISLIMYALTFYLVLKPEPFRQNNPKYQKSSLSVDFKKKNLERIRSLMDADKPFLDSEFSLDFLAQKCNLAKHHISQILNEELNQNFYEFMHQYRIEEAKRVLSKADNIKMENLATQLGYKSKATFFSAFKRATGSTPSLFK